MTDDRISRLLEEFLILYKVLNRNTIIEILRNALNNEQLLEIYQLTDGEKSTRDLAGMLKNKCSHGTVSNLWNKWALQGLVTPARQKGRYKAAFDLFEYGISKIENEQEDR